MRNSAQPLLKVVLVGTAILALCESQTHAARFVGRRHANHQPSRQGKGKSAALPSSPQQLMPPPIDSPSDQLVPMPPGLIAPRRLAPAPIRPVSPPPEPPAPVEAAPTEPAPVEIAPKPVRPIELTPADVEPVPLAPSAPPPAPKVVDPAPAPASAQPDPAPQDANPLENLFGDPSGQVPPAPRDPAPVAPVTDDPFDDLFGDPGAAFSPRLPNRVGVPGPPAVAIDLQEVFSAAAASRETPVSSRTRPAPEPLAARDWADDSGEFGVTGTLVQLLDKKVRIRKADSGTCTIDIVRLSDDDRLYVRSVRARIVAGENLQLVTD